MKKTDHNAADAVRLQRIRSRVEATAGFGLILVCAGLVAPFAAADNAFAMELFKWIFAAGALIFTVARMVNVNDPKDSMRVRRLRRMEMWAGFAFCFAAFFWFWNAHKLAGQGVTIHLLSETIMFALAGAFIQIISSWMLVSALKKQEKSSIVNDNR